MSLWKQRNGLFHSKGYCFGGALGQGYYGNNGCRTQNPALTPAEKDSVERILAREKQLACSIRQRGWTVADLQNHDRSGPSPATPAHTAKSPVVAKNTVIEDQLSRLGFNTGVVDGNVDRQTVAAINAFQRHHGFPVTKTLSSDQVALLEILARAARPAGQVGAQIAERPPRDPAPVSLASSEPAKPRQLRNPNASMVRNNFLPDMQFRLIKSHAVVSEQGLGGDSQLNGWTWLTWMRVNLPRLVPQILEMDDNAALYFANIILSEEQKRSFQYSSGLSAEAFLPYDKYGTIPLGQTASSRAWPQVLRKRHQAITWHADRFIRSELDEFTRQKFFNDLRSVLTQQISGQQQPLPLPTLQIFSLALGEYDFQNKRFPIQSVRGSGNSAVNGPEFSRIGGLAREAYRNRNVTVISDLKEFPLFLPMEPEAAKGLVGRLAQYRQDQHRELFLGVYGDLAAIGGQTEDTGSRRQLNLTITLEASHVEIAIDKDFNDVVYSFRPDKVTSADKDRLARIGGQKSGSIYDMEYLVASLSAQFPDALNANRLLQQMLTNRTHLENANLTHYGIAPDLVPRIVREDVKTGLRKPTSDDFTKYRAYLDGLKGGVENELIVVPTSVYVRENDTGQKTIEPGKPLDILQRGLEGAAHRFGNQYSGGSELHNLLRSGSLNARPGEILMPAGYMPTGDNRRSVPVFFSVRVNKSQNNAPLPLPQLLSTTANNGFAGNNGPFADARYDWEIKGHVALELARVPEIVQLEGARSDVAVIFSVLPREIVLVDREKELEFSLDQADSQQQTPQNSFVTPDSFYLDAETTDLLLVRHMPDHLTDADLRRMLLSRWHYESSFRDINERPNWGRFFEFGQRKPDAQLAEGLLESFRDWTTARAAAIPDEIELELPHMDLSQSGPARIGPSLINPNTVNIYLNSCGTDARTFAIGKHGVDHQIEMIKNSCAYLSRAAALPETTFYLGDPNLLLRDERTRQVQLLEHRGMSKFGAMGPRSVCQRRQEVPEDHYCLGMQKEVKSESFASDTFVLDDVLVFTNHLIVPEGVTRSDPNRRSAKVRIKFRVQSAERSEEIIEPPFKTAAARVDEFLVDQGIRQQRSVNGLEQPFAAAVPMNRLNIEIVSARYFDPRSGQVFGAMEFQSDLPQPDPDLLSPIEPKVVAAASEPYGPDVVGLKLGMTFEEADRIIREHMEVGVVLAADRSWSPYEAFGDIQPFSSGRLYESKDEKEVIVLFDEAPSASKVVMGVSRQLAFEKGKLKPAQIFKGLLKKYGKPEVNRDGAQYWGEANNSCAPFLGSFSNKSIWRNEDGSETDWSIFKLGKNSGIAVPGGIEERDVMFGDNCKHGLMASFDSSNGSEWDHLTQRLYDKGSYRTHFIQSARMMKEGVSDADEEQEDSGVEVKF